MIENAQPRNRWEFGSRRRRLDKSPAMRPTQETRAHKHTNMHLGNGVSGWLTIILQHFGCTKPFQEWAKRPINQPVQNSMKSGKRITDVNLAQPVQNSILVGSGRKNGRASSATEETRVKTSHDFYPCHPCMVYLPLITYIWLIFMEHVGEDTIHGWYGYWSKP